MPRVAKPVKQEGKRPLLGSGSLVLLLPVLILEVAVFFVPLVYVFWRSFSDWQPNGISRFIGFSNYVTLFQQPAFWQVVWNQAFFMLGLPVWVIAPLLMAWVLRERVPAAGLFRTIYFLPAVMAPAVVGLVFRTLLQDNGPVNETLRTLGLGGLAQRWLTDAALVKPVIIGLVLWAGFGTGVLIFSSAMSAIPESTLEAARLDGAGFWRELWYIAVPATRSTFILWTMYQVISIFLFMFGWVYVLTSGGPGLASTTMDYFIYQTFIRFGFFGTAAAQAVVLTGMVVVTAVILVGLPWVARRIAARRQQANGEEQLS